MPKQKEQWLRRLRSAHTRRKQGVSVCEGPRCCRELLRHRPEWAQSLFLDESKRADQCLDAIVSQAHRQDVEITVLSTRRFRELSLTENPQGIIAVFKNPLAVQETDDRDLLCDAPFILVLDGVQDPGNLGTILRTAWAAGLTDAWITKGTTEPFSPKAIRAGMGGQFALNVSRFEDIDHVAASLIRKGIRRLWLTVPAGGVSCYADDFVLDRSALVIGNEAHGVSGPHEIEPQKVSIPMPGGAESLNVAQAGTVLILEAVRRGLLSERARSSTG